MTYNTVAYMTLVRREVKRFMRIWIQTLTPPVVTTSLYFLIFGKLIGSRVGLVNGVSYIDFIAPGLIMMSLLTNAYSNVSSSFFSSKFQKNIEEQLVSSMPDYLIVLGYVTGGVFRALVVGAIVAVVAVFFTGIEIKHLFLTILIAVLSAIVFSFAGLINGLYAKTFDDISLMPTFVLAPLIYLGGVFYSLSMLPEIWQTVAKINPLLYVVNGFRYSILGVSDVPFMLTIIVLFFLVGVLFFIAIHLLKSSTGVRK